MRSGFSDLRKLPSNPHVDQKAQVDKRRGSAVAAKQRIRDRHQNNGHQVCLPASQSRTGKKTHAAYRREIPRVRHQPCQRAGYRERQRQRSSIHVLHALSSRLAVALPGSRAVGFPQNLDNS